MVFFMFDYVLLSSITLTLPLCYHASYLSPLLLVVSSLVITCAISHMFVAVLEASHRTLILDSFLFEFAALDCEAREACYNLCTISFLERAEACTRYYLVFASCR
ncbi:hypothetical protein BJ508DRAFT_86929 [Ascobolus immersus RN42]|uniref:Uncharacterized protein n=1 Tax=Ascobolus immersus RN42 TaxID=1160509 RepID=A0A3N4ID76_ASCIM|nr:hypothetical protein BJ508DRAFT_86929 [Ascobolus immersus RN42]